LVHIAERRDAHKILVEKCEREKDHMEDLGVDGRKILNACSRSKIRVWTALIWLRKGTNIGFLSTRQ
jgi:hypothetical protein